jgi:hypothetical protein
MAGHIYPPRRGDQRVVDFIAAQGGSTTGDINRDFAEALTLALGLTAADRNASTIDDLWKRYKIANGIEDTSEPFDFFGLLENYLLEDGDDLLTESGGALLLE